MVDACEIYIVIMCKLYVHYINAFVLNNTCFAEIKTNINIYLSDIRHNTLRCRGVYLILTQPSAGTVITIGHSMSHIIV